MSNPIQYDSETYNTILADINSDPDLVDKPDWFKKMLAGLGDVMSIQRNAAANNSFLRTAFIRRAVADLCQLIDYDLGAQSTSSGTLLFYLDPDAVAFPKTVALADLAATSQGSSIQSSKRFEGRAAANVAAFSESFTATPATDILTVATERNKYDLIRVSTTGTLPAPLQAGVNYYVIKVSATEIKLALNLADAIAGNQIDITTTGAGVHSYNLFSFTVDAYQQETIASKSIGTSDGITEWQSFDNPDTLVLEDTVSVVINSLAYAAVDTFVDSIASDRHFRFRYKQDDASFIEFGNGTFGIIPPAFDVEVSYAVGGGADSNITGDNKINTYAGGDSDITGVTNITDFTGGADEETFESAKRLAPLLLKARNRFVTVEDGKALAEAYDGVALAQVVKNYYGVLSVLVPIVPNGGGAPSGPLKTALETYLTDRTILGEVFVDVVDPTFNVINPTISVKVRTGYSFANVQPYVRLATKLLFTETGREIIDDYESNGIASAVTLINSYLTESFTSIDYGQIITLLDNLEYSDFGKDFQSSDVLGYIDSNVDGVDYVTTTLVFPITQTDDEITQPGAVTVNQIP